MWWDLLSVAAIVALAAGYLVWRRVRSGNLPPECASCGCACKAKGQPSSCGSSRDIFPTV